MKYRRSFCSLSLSPSPLKLLRDDLLVSDQYNDPELKDLTEAFKEQATKLVDMLDISIPVVAKLKVCFL